MRRDVVEVEVEVPAQKRQKVSSRAEDEMRFEPVAQDTRVGKYEAVKTALAAGDAELAVKISTEIIESSSEALRKSLLPFYLARSKAKAALGQTQASLTDAKLAIRADDKDPKAYIQAAACLKEAGHEDNCRRALVVARTKLDAVAPGMSNVAVAKILTMIKDVEDGLKQSGFEILPIEILIRIFIACEGDTISMTRMERVCRRWRQVLRHAPEPWKRVHLWAPQAQIVDTAIAVADIPAEPLPNLTTKQVRRALTHSASRCGGKIYSIQIDVRKGLTYEECHKVLSFLRERSASIHNLKVCGYTGFVSLFSECLKYPNLRSFYLSDGQGKAKNIEASLKADSAIQDLVLLSAFDPSAKLTNLRTLVVQGASFAPLSTARIIDTLEPSKDTIEHLRLGGLQGDHYPTRTFDKVIELPRLQSFEASSIHGHSRDMWKQVKAPNLRKLSAMSLDHEHISTMFPELCDVSRLEELCLSFAETQTTPESRKKALIFLSQMSNVRKLDLGMEGRTTVVDDIVTCLDPAEWTREAAGGGAPPEASPGFFPKLTTLIIRKHSTMTGSQLMRSVKARLQKRLQTEAANGSDLSQAAPMKPQHGPFKRAVKATAPAPAPATSTSGSTAGRRNSLEHLPLSVLILYRCPALDPRAEEWFKGKVPTFARFELVDRVARQRAEASSRRIQPW